MTLNEKETIENLYNLLRAVVFRFGRDVTLTKEEFTLTFYSASSRRNVLTNLES